MVRVDFKIDSECTLHSLNVNKLSKSILIKNAKDKMSCHLTQITKGFNVVAHIGFTPTDRQTADLATKYYEGLITNINSSKWRHGDASKLIPLLDSKTTFLTAYDGELLWVGSDIKCTVSNCRDGACRHISDIIHNDTFCEYESFNISFWQPYKYLFSSEGFSDADLDTHEVYACANERTQKAAMLSSSFSKSFNTLPLTGQMMHNFLPQIFNVFALHAFQAT